MIASRTRTTRVGHASLGGLVRLKAARAKHTVERSGPRTRTPDWLPRRVTGTAERQGQAEAPRKRRMRMTACARFEARGQQRRFVSTLAHWLGKLYCMR